MGRKFSVDGTALIKVSGVRKYVTTEPAQIDDPVHIGSCTKAMTAVLIGQLCSEGKIRLDSSLKEVFDDVEEITSSEWGNVTLLELMQHRSGAPANFDYREFDAKHPDSVVDARRMILVKLAKTSRPKSRRFLYSNVGFIVLGHVVEKLTSERLGRKRSRNGSSNLCRWTARRLALSACQIRLSPDRMF